MALDFSNVMTGHYGQMIIDGTVVTLELALGAWLLALSLIHIL
ncbi:ABC transporter permease, partial [Klebsiella pneumoniae]